MLMGASPGYDRLRSSLSEDGGGETWCIAACAAICDALKPELLTLA